MRRRVEVDLPFLEELLEGARVVVGVAVREDDRVDHLRRDLAAEILGGIDRRIDEHAAMAVTNRGLDMRAVTSGAISSAR